MRRHHRRVAALGLTASAAMVAALTVPQGLATAAPNKPTSPASGGTADQSHKDTDEPSNPIEDKRRALRQEAIQQVINGEATPEKRGKSTVVKVADAPAASSGTNQGFAASSAATTKPQYVELERESTDHIFVILTEFGTKRDTNYPDKDINPATPGPVKFDGPLHNQIPQPNRATDNSTNWQPDYSQSYFQNLYFGKGGPDGSGKATESVRQYFERQSSGRYSIEGTVTDWVKVPYNEARYGRSSDPVADPGGDPNVCADVVCDNTWDLVRDAATKWYNDQIKTRSVAEVKKELKSFDTWDRYDIDGDGNFNEPDGYLDHFQIVHAGGDESDGDPIQGEDAIWSHRWYAYGTDYGVTGPAQGKQGGTQIGNSGIWIGDYTAQPENGGMSVFAHEYTHDLGLPDLYDTNGGENSVEFWSLMAQSRESGPNDQSIGARASDLGAWEKLQLGWLDYETLTPEQNRTLQLGPHEYNTNDAQAAVVVLPKKNVTKTLVQPKSGNKDWWSGTGDSYESTMTRQVDVPTGSSALTFQGNYNIETGYDYAYVEVDENGVWKALPGTGTDPDKGNGIAGSSKGWKSMSFDTSKYAGQKINLRFRYKTDGGQQGNGADTSAPGLFVDDIKLGSFSDGAETSPNGWTLDGFSSVGATTTQAYDNYYLASYRSYNAFDKYLKSGPYNFGYANTRPDWVEHFPYQNGLLVSYWDTSQGDNNTSVHPGSGQILPVDANPGARAKLDGGYWRTRVAGYDAPFGLEDSETITLHVNGQANRLRGLPAVPVFRDDRSYYDPLTPSASVKVPKTGTQIRVLDQDDSTMKIRVGKTG